MIRLLDHTDQRVAEKMYHVFQVSYAVEAELLGAQDFFPPLQRSISDLQKSSTKFYGYWKEEQLAAVMEIQEPVNSVHIRSLIVDPVYFRQGIARQLLTFIEGMSSAEILTVETGLANNPACSLYENFGFEKEKVYMTDIGIEKIRFRMNITKTN